MKSIPSVDPLDNFSQVTAVECVYTYTLECRSVIECYSYALWGIIIIARSQVVRLKHCLLGTPSRESE